MFKDIAITRDTRHGRKRPELNENVGEVTKSRCIKHLKLDVNALASDFGLEA